LPLASGSLGGADPLEIAWAFSLDNVSGTFDTANNNAVVDGSGQYNAEYRTAGKSLTAQSQSVNGVSYQNVLDAGYDRFSTVLFGGFDGFDVTERDPFRNSGISATATEKTSYELATLKRAVNIIADADQVQYNLASIPGVTNQQATQHLLDTVEDRGDALAIIDIENVYLPDTENANTEAERNNFTITQAVTSLRDRNINTSYGATYAPWVLIQDTSNSRTLWAPPSVVALGALSTTDRDAAPWYAPAGFARGGLSEGAGGVPVLEVSRRLSSDDRDVLYDAGINPIAKFPAEGIVVFGQKTLQQTASALDRINVRRLMIFLKRRISFIASRLLFAPNTRDTWTRFTGQAIPVLDSVKAQFGIEDFRLILDESTTTPDLIDRNIIYSKLLVKPTRSAEFFAIDFVITNSGASFED
jgi:phage tail sheath protein FI